MSGLLKHRFNIFCHKCGSPHVLVVAQVVKFQHNPVEDETVFYAQCHNTVEEFRVSNTFLRNIEHMAIIEGTVFVIERL